jgi:hypothetical protein
VRLYRRRDGTVVTADCAPPLRKLGRRVAAGALAVLAGGCVDDSDDTLAIDQPSDDLEDLFPTTDADGRVLLPHLDFEPGGYTMGAFTNLSFTFADAPGDAHAEGDAEDALRHTVMIEDRLELEFTRSDQAGPVEDVSHIESTSTEE